MIKVTVELWPHGREADKKVLGRADIWNDVSGTPTRGNYRFRLWGQRKLLMEGTITDFPRQSLNAWHLLARVLLQLKR